MGTVLDALRALGARIDGSGRPARRAQLPFTLHGTGGLPGGEVVIDASASSQFVSGLLLSGAPLRQGRDGASTTASRCRRCRTST